MYFLHFWLLSVLQLLQSVGRRQVQRLLLLVLLLVLVYTIYMSFHVSFQVSTLRKAFSTHCAAERLLSCVSPKMDLQSARSHEGRVALVAFEGSLSRVSSLVIRQVTLGSESFVAPRHRAGERLLSRVDALVGFEVSLFSEGLPTARSGTDKRLLASL